jgi:hypothetical protein
MSDMEDTINQLIKALNAGGYRDKDNIVDDDAFETFDGLPKEEFDKKFPVVQMHPGCRHAGHDWVQYTGLKESYYYCKRCDTKKV